MHGVYETSLRLKNKDVDLHRRLKTSRLFELLQEASIAHTEALGMGREKTLDRGLLWVVTLQHCEIRRMPEYDECVRVLTWPGKTMHVMFPRYYRMETESGEELLSASALWVLVDENTRRLAFPEPYGVRIEGVTTGREISLPKTPVVSEFASERLFSVPYSYVDLNGHMNNTRYFDLAEDCLPTAAAGRKLRAVSTEYRLEVRMGEEMRVRWGNEGDSWYVSGETEKPCFRLRMDYAPEGT